MIARSASCHPSFQNKTVILRQKRVKRVLLYFVFRVICLFVFGLGIGVFLRKVFFSSYLFGLGSWGFERNRGSSVVTGGYHFWTKGDTEFFFFPFLFCLLAHFLDLVFLLRTQVFFFSVFGDCCRKQDFSFHHR